MATNNQTVSEWASSRARPMSNSNGTNSHDTRVLYSYGQHYPAAIHGPDGVVFFNSDTYSPTTARHVPTARSSVRPTVSIEIPTELMQRVVCGDLLSDIRDDVLAIYRSRIVEAENKLARCRSKFMDQVWTYELGELQKGVDYLEDMS